MARFRTVVDNTGPKQIALTAEEEIARDAEEAAWAAKAGARVDFHAMPTAMEIAKALLDAVTQTREVLDLKARIAKAEAAKLSLADLVG